MFHHLIPQYECSRCFKVYRHKQSLHKHVKFECGKTKTFVCCVFLGKPVQAMYPCERCNKSYKAATSLRRHQKVECGKSKNIVCKYCNHRFYYKQDWRCHMFTRHIEHLTAQDKSSTFI
nr:unnamed protein product [Callosobruchus chinensis]